MVTRLGWTDVEVDTSFKILRCLEEGCVYGQDLKPIHKRRLYNACVLPVLLYGAECWTPLVRHNRKLNSFHHRCIRIILGISNRQQWSERITMTEVRKRWGDMELTTDRIRMSILEWLGYLARMPDNRLLKSVLFGWLPEPRPRYGPRRKQWRDVLRQE